MKKISIVTGIMILIIALGVSSLYSAPTEEKVVLRFTSPPDPNFIPVSILLGQETLVEEGIELEYTPSQGTPDMMAHLQRGDVDLALFSAPGGVKMYAKGVKNIRLIGVHVWKAIYVVAEKNVSSWEDLKGKDIYIGFRGGPPDIITRASMKAEGYNPDKDFNIKYLTGSEIKQLILTGQADAAVFPEPHVSQLVLKSKGNLKAVIKPQEAFAEIIPNWKEEEKIPLGALWIVEPNIKGKEEAIEKFIQAFSSANGYAMNHPKQAGKLTSKYFKQYFGGKFPAKAVENSITSGRLELNFRKVKDVKRLMPSYLENLGFPVPDEGIYYQAKIPQKVERIKGEIKTTVKGGIVKYQEESFYSEDDFLMILKSKKRFNSQLIQKLKDRIIGVTAQNCNVDFDNFKNSTVLKCDIKGARYSANSYNMHFLLGNWPFDLYQFSQYKKKLIYEGKINGVPTEIIFEFPYELSHCHEHVWPK